MPHAQFERLHPTAALRLRDLGAVDICILVPKQDEYQAFIDIFAFEAATELGDVLLRDERYPFVSGNLSGLAVVIVCMEDQGNAASANATREILTLLQPIHVYLCGTALGNARRARTGSIRVSEAVDHIVAWVNDDDGRRPRFAHYAPPSAIRKDVGSYVNRLKGHTELLQRVMTVVQRDHPDEWQQVMQSVISDAEQAHLISDNTLERTDGASLWMYEERAAAYDMECGGFGLVLDSEPNVSWLVIRGISDFGHDKKSAEEGGRRLTSLLVASFTFLFIRDGLFRSHPRAMRPTVEPSPRLSSDQHYSQHSAANYFSEKLRDDYNVDLPVRALDREMSLADVAIHLRSSFAHDEALDLLRQMRIDYFDHKYLDYSYDVDIRGYFGNYWVQELRELLAWYGYENLSRAKSVDVGCGNGLELKMLYDQVQVAELLCVDISDRMLSRARELALPNTLQTLCASADDLSAVADNSVDVYLSLRTYMSRFFEVDAALREAYRVLAPGGLLVVSIANGYLEKGGEGEPSYIVPGLKDVNGSEFVNPDRPYSLLTDYHRKIRRLGFVQLHTLSRVTDVYLGALKPGKSSASMWARIR